MFTGCMKESLLDKVTMYDVEAEVLGALINYCYTGTMVITEENVIALLQSADQFQVCFYILDFLDFSFGEPDRAFFIFSED